MLTGTPMDPTTIKGRLTRVFQDIFDDPNLQITESMTADDVDAWDSLTHIDLIVEVERQFNIKLSTGAVRELKNVGDFIALISAKTA
jgi:acyl carrier protein